MATEGKDEASLSSELAAPSGMDQIRLEWERKKIAMKSELMSGVMALMRDDQALNAQFLRIAENLANASQDNARIWNPLDDILSKIPLPGSDNFPFPFPLPPFPFPGGGNPIPFPEIPGPHQVIACLKDLMIEEKNLIKDLVGQILNG